MILTWLVIIGAFALVGCLAKILRRQHAQRRQWDRSEKHEAYLAALQEWTQEPEIVEVARKQYSLTRQGFRAYVRRIHTADEPMIKALAARFLSNREVRRAVARHVARTHGMPKGDAMKALMTLVEVGRGE